MTSRNPQAGMRSPDTSWGAGQWGASCLMTRSLSCSRKLSLAHAQGGVSCQSLLLYSHVHDTCQVPRLQNVCALGPETAGRLQVQPGRDAHYALPAARAADAAILQEGGRRAACQGQGPHPTRAVVPGQPRTPWRGNICGSRSAALACACSHGSLCKFAERQPCTFNNSLDIPKRIILESKALGQWLNCLCSTIPDQSCKWAKQHETDSRLDKFAACLL